MSNPIRNRIIKEIAGSIDIPDSAYEKAEARYKDLGEWFGRKEARCHAFRPAHLPARVVPARDRDQPRG